MKPLHDQLHPLDAAAIGLVPGDLPAEVLSVLPRSGFKEERAQVPGRAPGTRWRLHQPNADLSRRCRSALLADLKGPASEPPPPFRCDHPPSGTFRASYTCSYPNATIYDGQLEPYERGRPDRTVPARPRPRATVRAQGLRPAGPPGGLFASELFTRDRRDATIFVPVTADVRAVGRVAPLVIPAAELAVATHHGSLDSIDVTYGQLGSYVTTHEIGVDGPLREYYLAGVHDTPDQAQWRTEIAWPIFRAA